MTWKMSASRGGARGARDVKRVGESIAYANTHSTCCCSWMCMLADFCGLCVCVTWEGRVGVSLPGLDIIEADASRTSRGAVVDPAKARDTIIEQAILKAAQDRVNVRGE
jgi:hypothetical protein